jgi:hypothetical protein
MIKSLSVLGADPLVETPTQDGQITNLPNASLTAADYVGQDGILSVDMKK